LAKAPSPTRQARLHFPKGKAHRLCGRLFLAPLSKVLSRAKNKRGLLEE